MLNAPPQAPSVALFNRLKWLPFYKDAFISKCIVAYKRLQGDVPVYLNDLLKVLLKRKFKVAFFYLKYFFIPRRSLITKNNATLRPRSRRDWCLKCGTKEGQNLKTESAN